MLKFEQSDITITIVSPAKQNGNMLVVLELQHPSTLAKIELPKKPS
ncbi:hypothetical protein VB733_19360 [Calothrix sp. UHCC 0171]|nr:hypothetical protein [Calothrix sp. UHCC 0171]MEA5573233.1 hypothetical protein [Calothrix sp. UHCC 0171]